MNNKILITIGLVVLIIIVAVVVVFTGKKNTQSTTSITSNTTTNPTITTVVKQQQDAVSVNVASSGFEPKELKIKVGTLVVWTNKSGAAVTVNSDNHPTHLLWPFLNLGSFGNNSSVSVIFEKPGVYTYHNHFNSSQIGKVTVE
mgnify:CR=1 FL=1